MGVSVSAIPHSLYKEIMHDIAPVEIEGIDVTIKLANRDTISPIGILGMFVGVKTGRYRVGGPKLCV